MATATAILVYDTNLCLLDSIRHDYITGIHEIIVDSSGIMVTSTLHDALVKIDHRGEVVFEWWGSQSEQMQRLFHFLPRELVLDHRDFNAMPDEAYERYANDERLHLNAAAHQGEEWYILSNRKRAIIRIHPGPETIIVQDDELISPHNLILTDTGRFILNNTGRQQVRVYARNGDLLSVIDTFQYQSDESRQFANAGWQRGLIHLEGDRYLCGTSPATIFEVDIASGRVAPTLRLDDDVRHCIHGLGVEG